MWLLQKFRGKMEPFEAKSQLDNHQQQHSDLRLQSDSSIDNDKIVQILAQDLENLILSCKDEVHDRYPQVVIDEQDQSASKDLQAESSSGSEEKNHRDESVERHRLEKVVEVDPKEFRVLEGRETDESEIGCGNQEEIRVLKGKHEIEIEDENVSSEIGDYENNGEQRGNEDGNDSKCDEHVEGVQKGKNVGGDDVKLKAAYHYPLRLDAEDCSYYIRTGMCKFGSNCKYNHPLRRKNQPAKETKKQKEENVEWHGQTECKHYTSSGGCKFGKACKFNHGRGKSVKTPVVDYNFVGLPIRPGEKECPYYMRNGSCKYGPSCRFSHPDPSAAGGGDSPTAYGNDRPLPLQPALQPKVPNMPSWSAPRTPGPTAAFAPILYSQTQNMPPPNPDWKGYQAPAPVPPHLYPNSEQGLPIPPAFFLNNPPGNTNMYTHHHHHHQQQQQQPTLVSDYPERPGQPDCSYFMKTGVCKYRASCKFHHPPNRTFRNLRDQNVCTYFSKHGTCKYGPACKYDHPVNYNSNSNPAGEGYDGSNGPRPMIQQSV